LLDVATQRVDGLRIRPLSQLAGRLRQHQDDRALFEATPDYLEGLAASLDGDQQTLSGLISTLQDNIRHIHDVIRDQQRHTGKEARPTTIALREVIEEAIGCCRARLDQDSVVVQISGHLDVNVRSDRSLLLQSVINVVGNAHHALRDKEDESRRLAIKAELQPHSVTVRFKDNGVGMSADTLKQVFDAHFTTRRSGSGLGLHFCAITLSRLGGSIFAESEGPGCGATFILELPLAAPARAVPRLPLQSSAGSVCAGVQT
jgi:C4-dicarboxylate-specific signal transduction histidine kinase